ncbi:methionine aminopeptidase [Paenibacillus mucilaginosus KNP414]|nr:methionine aminopeptidase [Paenibacillus mucilaginosus KNP414]
MAYGSPLPVRQRFFCLLPAEIVIEDKDGWSLIPPDRQSYIAQFEHTIVITRGQPLILTA